MMTDLPMLLVPQINHSSLLLLPRLSLISLDDLSFSLLLLLCLQNAFHLFFYFFFLLPSRLHLLLILIFSLILYKLLVFFLLDHGIPSNLFVDGLRFYRNPAYLIRFFLLVYHIVRINHSLFSFLSIAYIDHGFALNHCNMYYPFHRYTVMGSFFLLLPLLFLLLPLLFLPLLFLLFLLLPLPLLPLNLVLSSLLHYQNHSVYYIPLLLPLLIFSRFRLLVCSFYSFTFYNTFYYSFLF